ncbi:MAG TPA: GTPase HflX [Ignavibacteriaceae bacterium]|nr:GTPase HflX [Ignavibacteriaceae bacterium]
MIEIPENTHERAILAALDTRKTSREIVEEHLSELEELALTAGAETIMKLIQDRPAMDSAFYIGKGKAEELAYLVEQNEIDLVIFDDDLTPVQVRNLERLVDKKIIDRSGLILDIFASRAKSNEAKTQVELAQLQYMLPRLTRAWTHLSKQYGGIGTKGPGETQIETDRRMIRNRISHLKEKLKKIEKQRETQSQQRKDLIKITLVGYTNVGKSTLFNILTSADVFAENRLFATLDSTTRTLDFGSKEKLLISDTVGFIRKLPPNLVASFKSTLNEVREADIILHIIDITHPYFEDQIAVVENTLIELGSENKTQVKVFNKVDALADRNRISFVKNNYPDSVIISAQRGINISQLRDKLVEITESAYVEEYIDLNLNESKKAAKIHSLAEVLSTEYDDETIHITYRTKRENSEKIKKMIAEV